MVAHFEASIPVHSVISLMEPPSFSGTPRIMRLTALHSMLITWH